MAAKTQESRLPPQAIEAEQALLGCLLIDTTALPRIMGMVTADSFYKPAHGRIFQSMLNLFEKNETIDTITVVDQIKKNGDLETVGGAYYISGLSTETPSSENVLGITAELIHVDSALCYRSPSFAR